MSALPLSLQAYRAATAVLEPLAPLVLKRRARRGKEDPARLAERMGRPARDRPQGALAWLHGASVGESLSLLPLIEALRSRRPGLAILVTSGTLTSAELMAQRLPADAIHQFAPVDGPRAAARFLDHWRPDLAVFVESELWPNLLVAARARDIPTALVSARLSEASLVGWARVPAAARALLSGFRLVMGQDQAAAERLARLGARDDGRLNLKLAAAVPPVDPAALDQLRQAADGRAILVAASTHPGEEAVVLEAFSGLAGRPDRPMLVIVPRHPARGAGIAATAPMRRQGAGDSFGGADVYVADALGQLGTWFRLAHSAFVGGSLFPGVGGHNPIEAARLGAPIVVGPHVENWVDVYSALRAADAVAAVEDARSLGEAWARDLDDAGAANARADRARAVANRGADGLDAAADALIGLLP
ncbi:MAG TPA: glycosyltransferase N-terminal domain-containing protein [Caulobacteraceae bacterium]|jgi:3-deoxy-D-manno-octulosonic-acid transferase|nr:glycosyltransferase N-terminal domain-containing protein [Caulobacteraceae bacterium]